MLTTLKPGHRACAVAGSVVPRLVMQVLFHCFQEEDWSAPEAGMGLATLSLDTQLNNATGN